MQINFFSVMWTLAIMAVAFGAYREGGEAALIKTLIFSFILILALYVIGKVFGSKDPNKSSQDVIVSGMMRILLLVFILAIPYGILNMLGIVDTGGSCSATSSAYEECEPYPGLPSFSWMD